MSAQRLSNLVVYSTYAYSCGLDLKCPNMEIRPEPPQIFDFVYKLLNSQNFLIITFPMSSQRLSNLVAKSNYDYFCVFVPQMPKYGNRPQTPKYLTFF